MKKIKALLVLMGMEIGGAETHVLELAIGLKKQGVDVLVASNGGVYTQELAENGIKHFTVPLHNKKPQNMVRAFFQLAKIIRQERPDVVHGHARIPSFILGQLNRFLKFRFVTTAHWVFNTSGILKYLSNWGYRTIAVSNDIKQYLVENYGIHPQDITVTINGISMDKFAPNIYSHELIQELGLEENKRKIVYISRMDKDRSLVAHHLIQIGPQLLEKEDLDIIIVGGGNDFDQISAEAQAANQAAGKRYIITTGARTDIYKFVSIADFMVAVSRSALEAMSAAVPVIVAGNEGYLGIFEESKLADAIKTNFCCRGMAQSSPELLLQDLVTMLDYPEETLEQLGHYGRELIRTHYSVDKMVADNLAVYREIIAHGNDYKDFVISGYYGYKNSGDDALLSAIIEGIRKYKPDARFTVLSANPKETIATYGVDSVNRFHILKVKHVLKNAKVLISGGGSLIQDATSTHSLVYYIKIMKTALKCGCRVMIYANGIGPIYKRKNQKRAQAILSQVDFITLRDEKSLSQLRRMKIPMERVLLTADPASLIAPAPPEAAQEIFKQEKIPAGRYVAISVRNWKYLDQIHVTMGKVADYVYRKYGLIPLFIPMQVPDDIKICNQCKDAMEEKGYVLKKRYGFREIMAIVGQCQLVIGMRLHILMYAATMAIPVIGLVYDPKIEGYLEYMQQDFTIDATRITVENVTAMIDEIMHNQEQIRSTLLQRADHVKQIAEQNGKIAVDLLNEELL